MELFAKSHPDEVAGVVLVDSRHRDFLATCEAARLDLCGMPDSILADQPPPVPAEYRAFAMASDQIRAAGGFGSHPVRVLTATSHAGSPAREALWRSPRSPRRQPAGRRSSSRGRATTCRSIAPPR
jgi:hypothetical protein